MKAHQVSIDSIYIKQAWKYIKHFHFTHSLLFIDKALFNFIKHHSNYEKVPFGQFDTSISTFLIVFDYCSWIAHILMKSALLTRNPCNKYLFVKRNSH